MSEKESVNSAYEIDAVGKRGRVQDALTMTLDAIRGGADDDDLYFVGASLAYQLGDLEKAEQLVNALLARDPDHANGWMLFGDIFEAKGDIVRAGHGRLMAQTIFPALESMARSFMEESPSGGGLPVMDNEGISEEKISFDTMTFAEICTRQGYLNKALKIYHDLLKKRPHDPEIKRRIDDLNKRINND